ncbi:MAG: chemotaxis response regulator protein-glutamate methylesterase [Dehalococcoidia bacterium]
MIRVLVVDDSAFMRHAIGRVLRAQPDIEVVGSVSDGADALEAITRLNPDVVTLDVEMPRMDGISALEVIMREAPRPVVMLSSLTEAGAPLTIKALEMGAVDFVTKPAPPAVSLSSVEAHLLSTVRAAAKAAGRLASSGSGGYRRALPSVAPRAKSAVTAPGRRADRVLAIGCSTGGPRALLEVVPKLPGNLPAAVLIVQHMPAGFTRSLAERMDQASMLRVREAADGDVPEAGLALLAPGGRHMTLGADGRVVLVDTPPVHGVRPAVDVLFATIPPVFGARCVALIMTGMGSDGADGVATLRAAGARIVVEDATTAVVYGMPRAVVDRGLADQALPLPKIAPAVTDLVLSAGAAGAGRGGSAAPRRAVAG